MRGVPPASAVCSPQSPTAARQQAPRCQLLPIASARNQDVTARTLNMKRIRVVSTVIASVGYDGDAKVMDIEFRSGRLYRYFTIPEHIHRRLMNAKSIGRYFNTVIRDQFPGQEIDPEDG